MLTNNMADLNPCPAEPGYTLFCKQCRSRSVGFWRSALFAIKYANLLQQWGSSNLIGWKLEVGVASIYSARQGLNSLPREATEAVSETALQPIYDPVAGIQSKNHIS